MSRLHHVLSSELHVQLYRKGRRLFKFFNFNPGRGAALSIRLTYEIGMN